jgi:hypothetical protein
MDHDGSSDRVTVAAGALAPIVVGALLVAVRGVADNANIALALVVVVVAVGALGGRLTGAVAAITAAVSFNFFHTRPYLSLRIAAADDVETMTLLLVIGLIVGQVAAVARRRAAEARNGREELERLWRIAERAVSVDDPGDLLREAQVELRALLLLQECWWDPRQEPSTLPVLQPAGVFDRGRVHRLVGGDFELPQGGFDVPVRGQGEVLGSFRCVPTAGVGVGPLRRRTAVVLADIVALAARGHVPDDFDTGRRHLRLGGA